MGARVLTPVAWDQPRWLAILERLEYRRTDIGLRFWGPPLWLEVTMTGPDSDAWSTAGASTSPDQSWDWQSTDACLEAMDLAAAGADDDRLLVAASRYTIENLILNATHEIGEWLRFDAQRPFSAHGSRGANPLDADQSCDGAQGNGSVRVAVAFGASASPDLPPQDAAADDRSPWDRMAARANALAAAWRFSYLPGKVISYGAHGPAIADAADLDERGIDPVGVDPAGARGTAHSARRATAWSDGTLRLVDAPADEFVAALQRDVHALLVRYETARICDEFYVDGVRPWRLDPGSLSAGGDVNDDERTVLRVTIAYDR